MPPKVPTHEPRPHVVIVGGGFGGLYAARALAHEAVNVTLIDRCNYHLFQPLLYQVATAALNPSDIAYPIRAALRRQANAEVLLAHVVGIDLIRRRVILSDGEVAYDRLILATGATHSYFNHPEWARLAPGLKTIEDAVEIRKKVLLAYEAAEREERPDERAAWLTFVIVGAGPTGVELAGAFAEISRQAMQGEFRHVDPRAARVLLVEGTPRVLPTYPASLSQAAAKQLQSLGVEVRTSELVTAIDEGGVTVKPIPPIHKPGESSPKEAPSSAGSDADGAVRFASRTVIWAAGVAASPLAQSLGAPLDRSGRVLVNPDLTIPGHPEVFVVGDLAAVESDGKPVPGVAPAAIQGGKHAVRNLLRSLLGKPHEPFRYNDRGSLATIGRSAGVGYVREMRLTGFLAWFAWLAVHIFFLIGFRNRLLVIIQWAWAYITHRRPARLITGASVPLLLRSPPAPQHPPAQSAESSSLTNPAP